MTRGPRSYILAVVVYPCLFFGFLWQLGRLSWQHYYRNPVFRTSASLTDDRACSRPVKVVGFTEGPLGVCDHLGPQPAEALILHHEVLRRSAEAKARGGIGVVSIQIVDAKRLDCGGHPQCEFSVELSVGDVKTSVKAKYNTPDGTAWHSVAMIFDVSSFKTRISMQVFRIPGNTSENPVGIGGFDMLVKKAALRVGRGAVEHHIGQKGRLYSEIVFVGVPPPPSTPPSPEPTPPGGVKLVEVGWTNNEGLQDRTKPRKDAQSETVMWRGDSAVEHSAIVRVEEPPVPSDQDGHFLPVRNSTAECREACNKGVGCHFMYEGRGRLGNVLQEQAHIWHFLNSTRFQKGVEYSPGYSLNFFEFPEYACLDKLGDFDKPDYARKIVKGCPVYPRAGQEYDTICSRTRPSSLVESIRKFVLPHISRSLRTCLDTPRQIDEEKLLTIHLRGEDIFGGHVTSNDYENEPWQRWGNSLRIQYQSPCGFMQKILSTKDFTRVLIVSSQDLMNPCVKWLSDKRPNLTNSLGEVVEWELQTGNLVEDSCAMMKAHHFLISESSLSQNLVLYAVAAQSNFRRYIYLLKYQMHWMLECGTPGVTLSLWNRLPDPISSHWPPGVPPVIEWLKTIGPEMFQLSGNC